MASGTSTAAAPAAISRPAAVSRLLPAAVIVGVAVLLKLVYAPWYMNYDARYALLWARDAWRGHKPEYLADFAPTPHPLETAASSLALPFGDHADTVIVWAVLLTFGAVVYLVFRLGETLFHRWVGIVAALAVFTRPALQRDAILAYQDVFFAALVIGAVLYEARKPKRGYAVPILLALAGLLRPEAWLLSALYLAYNWRDGRRVPLAALAATAPLVWAVSDWIVTGDPLHSLHGTAELAVAADRRRHVWQVPYWTVQYFGYIVREPLVAAIPIGLAFAYVHRLRQAILPLAAAAAMTAIFVIGPIFGLPLIGRYLRTPAELLSLFYGLAVCGFVMLAPGKSRDRWRIAGLVALGLSVAFLPWHAGMLRDLHRRSHRDGALYADLKAVAQAPRVKAAFKACAPLSTADHRPIPYLRYWLGGDPGTVGTIEAKASPLGRLLLVPRRSLHAKRFYRENFPARTAKRPAGYRILFQNRTYRVYAAPGCVTRPPS
jgi:hypothetical protein